jgi:hypothetical protein
MTRQRSSEVAKTAAVASDVLDVEGAPRLAGLASTRWVDIFAFFECLMASKDDEVCQTSKLAVSVKSHNSLLLTITFMGLLVKPNIHKLPRRELEPFVNSLEHIFVDKDDKVFPAPQLAELPNDDDVREFTRGYYRKISMTGKVVMSPLQKDPCLCGQ